MKSWPNMMGVELHVTGVEHAASHDDFSLTLMAILEAGAGGGQSIDGAFCSNVVRVSRLSLCIGLYRKTG